jgi:hypothetical protein
VAGGLYARSAHAYGLEQLGGIRRTHDYGQAAAIE